jgi:predicted dinucleotide-binding enzyme
MLLCGNDLSAKRLVGELASDMGWEPVDVGPLSQALHLEHMTLLWIKMVRENGAPVRTVWARVTG